MRHVIKQASMPAKADLWFDPSEQILLDILLLIPSIIYDFIVFMLSYGVVY